MLEAACESPQHETIGTCLTGFWDDSCSVEELHDLVPDFRKAHDESEMAVEELDGYGATVRTLRGLIAPYHGSTRVIREDFMLPTRM
ncbi:hypothetical protein BMS3Abin02_00436 [bacterium BMS3Abin02]|nr:hypothetical protein BMS3Abin02_00436 [bacterium BMS3Abin02]